MIGEHTIKVTTRIIDFEITVRRRITVIIGDSATGKSWFVTAVNEGLYDTYGASEVQCDVRVEVMLPNMWRDGWTPYPGTIYILDEDCLFMHSDEFAERINKSDCYYILITRGKLAKLPFSIQDVYQPNTIGKIVRFEAAYTPKYDICRYAYTNGYKFGNTDLVITEDSNSGFDLFNAYANVSVKSAHGKDNIRNIITEYAGSHIVVVADGAALGSCIQEILYMDNQDTRVILLAPESFEWLILKSGIIGFLTPGIQDILQHTENYADSKEYLSWERFYTSYITQITDVERQVVPGEISTLENHKYDAYKYNKKKLNLIYLAPGNICKIVAQLETDLIPEKKRLKGVAEYVSSEANTNDTVKTNYFSK